MGVHTRGRIIRGTTVGGFSGFSNGSVDVDLKRDLQEKFQGLTELDKTVFLRQREYSDIVEKLFNVGLAFSPQEQAATVQRMKEGISSLSNFHDGLSQYIELLESVQSKHGLDAEYSPDVSVLAAKAEVEQRLLQNCSEYLDGDNAVEEMAALDSYDMEPVLDRYTDFDNIKTIVETVADSVKFSNPGISLLLSDASEKILDARDMLKKYLVLSETVLESKRVGYGPTNDIGYYDKNEDRVYVNVDKILERLDVTSLTSLRRLPEQNRIKKDFYETLVKILETE